MFPGQGGHSSSSHAGVVLLISLNDKDVQLTYAFHGTLEHALSWQSILHDLFRPFF